MKKKECIKRVATVIATLIMALVIPQNAMAEGITFSKEGETHTFYYSGKIDSFIAPKNGIYKFDCYSASGGGGSTNGWWDGRGGSGSHAWIYVSLKKGQTIYYQIGGGSGYPDGGGGSDWSDYTGRYIKGHTGGSTKLSLNSNLSSPLAICYGGTGGWHDHTTSAHHSGENTDGGNGSYRGASVGTSCEGYSSGTGGGLGGTISVSGQNGYITVTFFKKLFCLEANTTEWTNELTLSWLDLGQNETTLYLNGQEVLTTSSYSAKVKQNGTYLAQAEIDGEIIEDSIVITNIDSTPPQIKLIYNSQMAKKSNVCVDANDL